MKTPIQIIYNTKCILLPILSIFLVSCETGCYLQQLYLIENKTDKELMVYFEYGFFTYDAEIKKQTHYLKSVFLKRIAVFKLLF